MPTLLAQNLALFPFLNAPAGLSGGGLWVPVFLAEALIAGVPLVLAAAWLRGRPGERQAAIRALAAALAGLLCAGVLGVLLPMPRPFALGIGHTYLMHAADASFPSDHVTLMAAVGFALLRAQATSLRRAGAGLLAAAVLTGLARVYLGVHFPLDIVGGFALGAGCAALATARRVRPALDRATALAERLYRCCLAYPIAHGWLNR